MSWSCNFILHYKYKEKNGIYSLGDGFRLDPLFHKATTIIKNILVDDYLEKLLGMITKSSDKKESANLTDDPIFFLYFFGGGVGFIFRKQKKNIYTYKGT